MANLNLVELVLGKQKFTLRSEETVEHLQEVSELVKRKMETIRKHAPTLTLERAAVLAAFELASDNIKGKIKANEYRSTVMSQATQILDKVEKTLNTSSTNVV